MKNLTNLCQKFTGNKIKIGKVLKTSIYDVPYFISDNTKLKKTYNWKPKRSLDRIIDDIYKWIINNRKVWKYFK